MSARQIAIRKGCEQLNDFQRGIIKECLIKETGGLSLPMGSGKTLISLILGLMQSKGSNQDEPILVVVSKSLIVSWEYEINKFFGDKLKYEVFYKNPENFIIKKNTILVLTTVDILSKCYKYNNVSPKFVEKHTFEVPVFNGYVREMSTDSYKKPLDPFIATKGNGLSFLYSRKFCCFIVDEVQKFTNISTVRCQSLGAICANKRWVLSGTMFDEPKPERILGYYVILDHPTFPRNLQDTIQVITNYKYEGLKETLVKREQNISFVAPKLNKIIISHDLSSEESLLYLAMKKTLNTLKLKVKEFRADRDNENVKRFSSYLMAMITYLRQGLVCPLIPVANIALDMSDYNQKSELSKILHAEFEKIGIIKWMEDVDSAKSTRIKKVLEVIDKHKNEKLVLFTCFRTSVNMINYFIEGRKVLLLTADMNIKKRGDIISEFQNGDDDSILFLTYELGAEGLNLQCSHTVLIIDFWWNSGKTCQAIARVNRYGQKSNVVNVYFFTGNTGIEKALFVKQQEKLLVLSELENGPVKSTVGRMGIDQILKLIDLNENTNLLTNIGKSAS